MMRVLQIANRYLQFSGEDFAVDRIAATLANQGVEIEEFYTESAAWKDNLSKCEMAARIFYNPETEKKLIKMHAQFPADLWLVHNIWPVCSPAVHQTAARLGVPVVQYLHNWRPFSISGTFTIGGRLISERLHPHFLREILAGTWQGSRLRTATLGMSMAHARLRRWFGSIRAWIGVSEFARDKFVEAGLPASQTFGLRHSWDLINPDPIEPNPGSEFLFLGRLTEEKGVRFLLRVWESLSRELGDRTPILRIAGAGPLENELLAPGRPWLRFEGALHGAKKNEALRSCRAILAPSQWWEPLGFIVYEAYDFSKPVIAAKSGGLGETVQNGQTGYLHDPSDVDSAARCILDLHDNPGKAVEMGARGRAWLISETTGALWFKKFQKICQTALDQ